MQINIQNTSQIQGFPKRISPKYKILWFNIIVAKIKQVVDAYKSWSNKCLIDASCRMLKLTDTLDTWIKLNQGHFPGRITRSHWGQDGRAE